MVEQPGIVISTDNNTRSQMKTNAEITKSTHAGNNYTNTSHVNPELFKSSISDKKLAMIVIAVIFVAGGAAAGILFGAGFVDLELGNKATNAPTSVTVAQTRAPTVVPPRKVVNAFEADTTLVTRSCFDFVERFDSFIFPSFTCKSGIMAGDNKLCNCIPGLDRCTSELSEEENYSDYFSPEPSLLECNSGVLRISPVTDDHEVVEFSIVAESFSRFMVTGLCMNGVIVTAVDSITVDIQFFSDNLCTIPANPPSSTLQVGDTFSHQLFFFGVEEDLTLESITFVEIVGKSAAPTTAPTFQFNIVYDTLFDGQLVNFLDGSTVDDVKAILEKSLENWGKIIASDNVRFATPDNYDVCGINEFFESIGITGEGITQDKVPFHDKSQIWVTADTLSVADFSPERGGTLAAATLCNLVQNPAPNEPRITDGVIIIDPADVQDMIDLDLFEVVLTHEIGHVLGIGTIWTDFGIVTPSNTYVGEAGIEGQAIVGGSGAPIVEDGGGAGTAGGHWEESIYQNEMMTGFIDNGANPMSALTIKSLEDIGFNVNLGFADTFFIPGTGRRQLGGEYHSVRVGDDTLNLKKGVV